MRKEYQDFLNNFATDEDILNDLELKQSDKSILNNLLRETMPDELITFTKDRKGSWLSGFNFFDNCCNAVLETNKVKFLEFTWIMFSDQASAEKDNHHPWCGVFDPLHEADFKSRRTLWFLEGVIRFEFTLQDKFLPGSFLLVMDHTYNYNWWNNIEHFLDELCQFQSKEFVIKFLQKLSKKLNKQEKLSLSQRFNKYQNLQAFKNWADEDLKHFNAEDIDWYDGN